VIKLVSLSKSIFLLNSFIFSLQSKSNCALIFFGKRSPDLTVSCVCVSRRGVWISHVCGAVWWSQRSGLASLSRSPSPSSSKTSACRRELSAPPSAPGSTWPYACRSVSYWHTLNSLISAPQFTLTTATYWCSKQAKKLQAQSDLCYDTILWQ